MRGTPTQAAPPVTAQTVTITQSTSALTLAASANSLQLGQSVTLTASLTPTSATGSIIFKESLNLSLKAASTASSVLAKIEGAEVTAHFSGTSKDYKIKVTAAGSFTIKDLRSKSPDGAGTIKGAHYFQFSDIKTATRSGDAMIDALLMGGTNQFWHSGQSATLGTNAIKPGLMGLSSESALHELKYCFLQSAEGSSTDKKGFVAMNETQKAAVEKALTYLSSLANLTFTLTTDPTQANIKFGTNKQNASAAYAYLPHELKVDASYLFLANNQASSSDFSEGSYGWEVLLHELGHAVGLKHPGNYDAGGGGTPGPYLPGAFDTRRYTIMSYNNPKDGSQLLISQNGSTYNAVSTPYNPSTYMVHDIAALQYLYGANTSAAQSGASTNLANFKGFQTLWAPNNGVIDASSQTSANLIDTRGGAYCSIGIQTPATEALKDYPAKIQKLPSYSGLLNLGIAYGSVITSVQGGTKEDKIFANEAASLMTIDGGAGQDIAYLAGDAADWSVDQANKIYTRASTGQSITLHNIETVSFYDPATTSLMMTA